MQCPYCGGEMRQGILSGDGRSAVVWREGEKKTAWVDRLMGAGKLTAVKYTLASFSVEAHYCDACGKMIIETELQQ